MRFRILGPVEVRGHDGGPLRLEPRQARLLATLLLASNHVVAQTRLIDAVWDGEPPRTVEQQLQNLASALRRRLREAGAVEEIDFDTYGYRISVNDDQLDARIFARHLTRAQVLISEDQIDGAVEQLRAGLALWRGSALEGCINRTAAAAAARLNEQRMTAIEQRVELELQLGRHHELVDELVELVMAHPHHEGFAGQLMLALHRGGRHARALDTFQQVRKRLRSDLGCLPGPDLQALYKAILNNAPHTQAPIRSPATTAATTPARHDVSNTSDDDATDAIGTASREIAEVSPIQGSSQHSPKRSHRTSWPATTLRGSLARVGETSRSHPVFAAIASALVVMLAVAGYLLPRQIAPVAGAEPIPSASTTMEQTPPSFAPPTPHQAPNAQGQPPLVTVLVNPLRDLIARGAHMAYVFDQPVEDLSALPEDYRDPEALAAWAYANGGGDADSTYVELVVEGERDKSIILTALTIKLVGQRTLPSDDVVVRVNRLNVAPGVSVQHIAIDLDDSVPTVDLVGGGWGTTPQPEQQEFAFRVSATEPQILRLRANTSQFDCTWYAQLHYTVDGRSDTVEINNQGQPFRTVASASATRYNAQPDGSLSPSGE